jgi:hypothetical protein
VSSNGEEDSEICLGDVDDDDDGEKQMVFIAPGEGLENTGEMEEQPEDSSFMENTGELRQPEDSSFLFEVIKDHSNEAASRAIDESIFDIMSQETSDLIYLRNLVIRKHMHFSFTSACVLNRDLHL